jgi:hypothetical protein
MVAFVFALAFGCSSGTDAAALARGLDADFVASVPSGSAKDDVIAFLRAHKVTFHEEPSLRIITASIPDVERTFLTRSGVYMKFSFDERGQLTAHEIKVQSTGP